MKNKKIVYKLLLLIGVISIFIIYNNDKEKVQLDEVKLKDNEVSKKQFAVYIREGKNEEYKEYNEENLFPVGYKLDLEQSGCVDDNGNKVEEGIITQTTDGKITVSSNKTVYCYLYFEKSGFNGTGKELAQSKSKGLIATPGKGDLAYRYVGTKDDVENYICFGTTNKDDCTPEDSNYLYRIIGVDTNDRLKLIKDTTWNTSTSWHSDQSKNAVWDTGSDKIESELYTNLNSSTFLNSDTYVPNGWKEKIDKTKWNIGDVTGDSYAQSGGDAICNQEKLTQSTTLLEIGLMYLSDYYYSLDGAGTTNCRNGGSSNYAKCKTSWIHLTNNGLSQSYAEWTMSRYGYHSSYDYYAAWLVSSNGQTNWNGLNSTLAIRPVFYLKADSVIKSGSGTSDDPYILEDPNKKGIELAQSKFGEVPQGFKTTPVADLYRFVGKQEESESINNYVCFGANDCKKDATNEHLYRIIGITDGGNLKIQKNKALESTSQWWMDYKTDKPWAESKIYELLKGTSFYDSETYVSQDMKTKIETDHTWNTGDVRTYTSGDTIYNLEKQTKSSPGAVGLAYLSDYYYAYDENGNQNCNSGDYCKSWMIPSDYQTLWSSQSYEWTMTRYGPDGSFCNAWVVATSGYVTWHHLNVMHAVRPVFYLKSDVKLTTNGDSSDPKGSLKNPWIVDLQ